MMLIHIHKPRCVYSSPKNDSFCQHVRKAQKEVLDMSQCIGIPQ